MAANVNGRVDRRGPAHAPHSANSIKKMTRRVLIRDTLSGELRPLEAREPGGVGIYACGPTTYSRIHIGNARPYVVFMLLRYKQDLLEARGFERSTISSSQAQRDNSSENELFFNRYMSITGYVRHSWPKRNCRRIESTSTV